MPELSLSFADLALPVAPAPPAMLTPLLIVLGTVALLLWSGRVRQQVLVNVLALGIMLPLVNLGMVTLGAYWLERELQPALLGLLPPWIG